MQQSPLSLAQYLDSTVFGLERCRLTSSQRRAAYKVYSAYAHTLNDNNLWDDADLVAHLLKRSELKPLSVTYDKVYVDEVQDNTQAEIVLYFLATGMNTQALFLAGDPAQSVVEGVDFRFEDVRSVVYKLSGGRQAIHRPVKLFVNYRSHSGILNCAAAVLDRLFIAFPGSAKVLPKDAGLFNGPRPAVSITSGTVTLIALLSRNQRLIVICLDDRVTEVESLLHSVGVVNLVLGIRAAKGLEFQDIVLYDFFSSIPAADHKAWKSLLTGGNGDFEPYSHPQMEQCLKLLYTAITRSCNRLVFIESRSTPLTLVVSKWLKSLQLVDDLVLPANEDTVVMTRDEWRVRGIDFALSAEDNNAESFLNKAVYCFTLSGDTQLQERAQAQLSAVLCHHRIVSGSYVRETMCAADEAEAASVITRCLESQLVEDARELCGLVAPLVQEQKYFSQIVGTGDKLF